MTDVEHWWDDMNMWGLTMGQRHHHMQRMFAYHRRVDRVWDDRDARWTQRVRLAAAAALFVFGLAAFLLFGAVS